MNNMQECVNTIINLLIAVSTVFATIISFKAVSREEKARERLKVNIIVTKYTEAIEKLSDAGILLWTKPGSKNQKELQSDNCSLLKYECDRLHKCLMEYFEEQDEIRILGSLKEDMWEEITNYDSLDNLIIKASKRDDIVEKKNKILDKLMLCLYSKKYKF